MGCCRRKKNQMQEPGKYVEVKMDVTKIVKCLCTTALLITTIVFLPKILKTLFVFDDEE